MTPGVDIAQLSNVIMSLGLVLAVILGAAYVLRRTPFGAGGRRNGPLQVVATLALGPKERLLLVQARDTELLIAVSAAGVFNIGGAHFGTTARAAGDNAAHEGVVSGPQPASPPVAPQAFVLGEHP